MAGYIYKAHPTLYKGTMFRSRLEARWAAFFSLAGWEWEYEPYDLEGWTPDFKVWFYCGHSECFGGHTLLVEVKPYESIDEFDGHPCMDYPYGCCEGKSIPANASAAFGINPYVTHWEMAHGSGGGYETIANWVTGDIEELWKIAGNCVQWKPS